MGQPRFAIESVFPVIFALTFAERGVIKDEETPIRFPQQKSKATPRKMNERRHWYCAQGGGGCLMCPHNMRRHTQQCAPPPRSILCCVNWAWPKTQIKGWGSTDVGWKKCCNPPRTYGARIRSTFIRSCIESLRALPSAWKPLRNWQLMGMKTDARAHMHTHTCVTWKQSYRELLRSCTAPPPPYDKSI